MRVVPRLLIRKPAMPSQRSTVCSVAANASAPKGWVVGAFAWCDGDVEVSEAAGMTVGCSCVMGYSIVIMDRRPGVRCSSRDHVTTDAVRRGVR